MEQYRTHPSLREPGWKPVPSTYVQRSVPGRNESTLVHPSKTAKNSARQKAISNDTCCSAQTRSSLRSKPYSPTIPVHSDYLQLLAPAPEDCRSYSPTVPAYCDHSPALEDFSPAAKNSTTSVHSGYHPLSAQALADSRPYSPTIPTYKENFPTSLTKDSTYSDNEIDYSPLEPDVIVLN